ncbi:hypothetical protein D7D52_35855 [Nocardia yunnanensis]|uniref:Uncharacterized protein n=1 Tax=Nocardia yunnanensis TaxID=2382165 RepID=A0A386ZP28_9NOCA|nr:hypothetical protein [Nocardia yunnanensis]AYF78315.1 hypothetical protein D7D52_35855 [Nocardia yunnanensis]
MTTTETLIERGEFMAEHLASVTPLSRLAERWVIVLPGGALYSADGPVHPGTDWDPDLFRTEADAKAQLDRLVEESENIGVADWSGQVCRLGEVGAVTVAPIVQAAPDLAAFNAAHPAPPAQTWREFAILAPGGAYREYDPEGDPFVTFPEIEYAQDRAGDITEDWAPRLGVADHPVVIVSRTYTTTVGPWEPA